MKSEFTFFTKEAVKKFLGNYGKEKTKDYEFAVALIMHRFYERIWGENFWIGFRIKSKYSNYLPDYNSKQEITLEKIADLLHKYINEDGYVDFVIAKMVDISKAQGTIFQVKQFGIGRDKKDTGELISYINSFYKKYNKADADLVIFLGDGVNVNILKLYSELKVNNFPFNKLIFSWIDNDLIYIQDIHPLGDKANFPITDLFSVNIK